MNAIPERRADANFYDVEAIRRDFPILSRSVYGERLVYLDNGASAQKPRVVLEATRLIASVALRVKTISRVSAALRKRCTLARAPSNFSVASWLRK